MENNINTLQIAEKFYSVQGEGATVGIPSYFIRLQSCNLTCGSTIKGVGDLVNKEVEGKPCTWYCDTIIVWRKGTKQTFQSIIDDWKKHNIYEKVLCGDIHIIWTGGEPTLPRHRRAIIAFNKYVDTLEPLNTMYQEIETNGTIICIEEEFYGKKDKIYLFGGIIDQINCSPKLANSGMKKKQRIIPAVIKQIQQHPNHWFKFVISTEEDIKEIYEDYITPFEITHRRIIIMPGVDNLADLSERTHFLFGMTKKYGFRGITRQHILAYNKTCGV